MSEKCADCGQEWPDVGDGEIPLDVKERLSHPGGPECLRRQLAAALERAEKAEAKVKRLRSLTMPDVTSVEVSKALWEAGWTRGQYERGHWWSIAPDGSAGVYWGEQRSHAGRTEIAARTLSELEAKARELGLVGMIAMDRMSVTCTLTDPHGERVNRLMAYQVAERIIDAFGLALAKAMKGNR